MTECEICCEYTNNSTRKQVICPYCEEMCCRTCFKRHLLSRVTPTCPSCNKTLSLEFVSSQTPKCFHNKKYRDHRVKNLLSIQRSLLPDSQDLVKERIFNKKRRDKVIKLQIEVKEITSKIIEIHSKKKELKKKELPRGTKKEKVEKLKKEKEELSERRKTLNREIVRVGLEQYIDCPRAKKKKKFIMGCTNGDCRGFLSKEWQCGTCEKHICSKCHCVKEEDHVCKKEDIETAKMIVSQTKPCPKCAVRIYKISGCDQMFCVECKTAFSWKTGEIEKGLIHNPHYYEWQRRINNGVIPRNPGDIVGNCDLPWLNILNLIFEQLPEENYFLGWENCHRSVRHIQFTELRNSRERAQEDNGERYGELSMLRADYLMKVITEEDWIKKLKRIQKRIEKNRDVAQILEMYVSSMKDIFNSFVRGVGYRENFAETAHNLRKYVNSELTKLRIRYSNMVPFITENWSVLIK